MCGKNSAAMPMPVSMTSKRAKSIRARPEAGTQLVDVEVLRG